MYQKIIKKWTSVTSKNIKILERDKGYFPLLIFFFLFNNFVCLSLYDSSVLCKALHKSGDSVRKINAKKK